ncbi:uncharacterized protein LOC122720942 [Apis laboriosa]|uniref:uncharacterized protein LOC122720942 n=1 Tax=Apis laboriosa TaxID=183418 RepID=UPI001CC46D92|nr:uncharacterized protein LOC122720942 [Apis laboriosa]XP_043804010.1 uncharacterized protein LOC122720942 [Apis laboriosa]
MEKSKDTFAWIYQLECPPIIFNTSVQKILNSRLIGLMWDDLADVIFNTKEAKIIRKNILLHHLKQGTSNNVIECMKNLLQLKLNKNDLKNQISKLEEEYEQQDFIVRQKVQKLQDISSKRSEVRAKRDLLKMKYDQTKTQLNDCNDMRAVCHYLMPSTCKDLDHKILIEMSDVVTSLWTGANKRHVWDTISSNLNHIEVSTLWHYLYQKLSEDVNILINSETMKSMDTDEKNINIAIVKLYGQHISMVSKRLLHNTRANHHEQNVLEYIEKIETASNNSTDISDWLALTLEVHKLENEQKNLQEEIEKIQDDIYENNVCAFDLSQLSVEIQNVDSEIAEYIQNIRQSLILLKCAPRFLIQSKEKINSELQKIITMRADGYDSTMLENDLTTELDIFYDILDLNALKKVMLKGEIGVYRYMKSCFNEACVSITNSQFSNIKSYFPLIQIPIYSLIECYKNLISMYKKFEVLETEQNLNLPMLTYKENNYNTIELLNLSKVINVKTRTEIDKFNNILNDWVNQPVQKVMEIIDKTVDNATFSEWIERYDVLLYMLQNST